MEGVEVVEVVEVVGVVVMDSDDVDVSFITRTHYCQCLM